MRCVHVDDGVFMSMIGRGARRGWAISTVNRPPRRLVFEASFNLQMQNAKCRNIEMITLIGLRSVPYLMLHLHAAMRMMDNWTLVGRSCHPMIAVASTPAHEAYDSILCGVDLIGR